MKTRFFVSVAIGIIFMETAVLGYEGRTPYEQLNKNCDEVVDGIQPLGSVTCVPLGTTFFPAGILSTTTQSFTGRTGKDSLMLAAGPAAGLSLGGYGNQLDQSSVMILRAAQDVLREESAFSNADENSLNQEIFERSSKLESEK